MPPRPRGLKAARAAARSGAAATAANGSETSAPAQQQQGAAATGGADDSPLTLDDLRELASDVRQLLRLDDPLMCALKPALPPPFLSSASTSDSTEQEDDEAAQEQEQEAVVAVQNFCRGILHSADFLDRNESIAGASSKGAAGLAHVQGLALEVLALFAPGSSEEDDGEAEGSERATKRRKLEDGTSTEKEEKDAPAEPTDPLVWLETSITKLGESIDGSSADDEERLMALADGVRALASRTALLCRDPDGEAKPDELKTAPTTMRRYLSQALELIGSSKTGFSFDSLLLLLRALMLYVSLFDDFAAELAGGDSLSEIEWARETGLKVLKDAKLVDTPSSEGEIASDEDRQAALQWTISHASADAALAAFVSLAEALESKYRPANDDEDDEGEEKEPEPFPAEADAERKKALASGQLATSELLTVLEAIKSDDLPVVPSLVALSRGAPEAQGGVQGRATAKVPLDEVRQALADKLEEAYTIMLGLFAEGEDASKVENALEALSS